ncbi:MAG TPA: hypothetical protein VHF00_07620, partial [Acidimicrobiales bacterium]|nr:hypothetical protein [Acidimicrobiales bacterium]
MTRAQDTSPTGLAEPEWAGHLGGDALEVAAAVDRLEGDVEQLGELHHLAVLAPDERGRLLEPRLLELADEGDAIGPLRDPRRAGRTRARRPTAVLNGGAQGFGPLGLG